MQPTNVALIAVGLLVTWPPAAYALIVLAGAGALLLDQNHALCQQLTVSCTELDNLVKWSAAALSSQLLQLLP